MRIVFIGFAILLGIARLNAATYYIDYSGGSDQYPGTSTKIPWQHCPGDPSATGVAALATLKPGDTILFKGGVTYVFTGTSGVALTASGTAGKTITYDGNSSGKWGKGRARFTDQHSAHGITAFQATGVVRHLEFKSLEFVGIGGAPSAPPASSTAVQAKYGGGISFEAGCESVAIEDCVFRELGYWFNKKPMTAAAIRGTGITSKGATKLTISNCDFSRIATGCDFSSGVFSEVEVTGCDFRDSLVWPLNLPEDFTAIAVVKSKIAEDTSFSSLWEGFGDDPRTEVINVKAGDNVSFVATAVSSPAPSFQWRRNGVPIPGATSAKLKLKSVNLADSGLYTAVATNSGGSTTSNSAVVVVTGALQQNVLPVITQEPANLVAALLSTVSFSVTATGTPPPTYQWMKDGVPIKGATDSTLTLPGITLGGTFTVLVSNTAGSVVSRPASLLIGGKPPAPPPPVKPSFTTQPADAFALLSDSVTFTAAASGTSPSYQWQKNGVPIAGATNATLTLSSLTAADAGKYSVIVKNASGSDSSEEATLTIGAAPTFTDHPLGQSVALGAALTLTATATGVPTPTLQWRKDGVQIAGATKPSLVFTQVLEEDEGSYSVVAKNSSGSATSASAALIVQKPAPPPPPPPPPPPAVTQLVNQMITLGGGEKRSVSFVVDGKQAKSVLIRAVGPTLSTLGIAGALADPRLQLYSKRKLIASNDQWGGDKDLVNAFAVAGATPFVAPKSLDAAILTTLPPGAFDLILTGGKGLSGKVLIEVYEMP